MPADPVLYYGAFIPSLLAAITCHEYAHARLALLFGDTTAQQAGRVSLNPLVHLDPVGTLALVFFGFGWGKPVPVNRARLRCARADVFVSAAGPVMNLLLAFCAARLLRLPVLWDRLAATGLGPGAHLLAAMFLHINLVLGVFNLLPIHPLDGSHVVQNLLPAAQAARFERLNRSYGPILLILLVAGGYVLPVSPISAVLGGAVQFLKALFLGA